MLSRLRGILLGLVLASAAHLAAEVKVGDQFPVLDPAKLTGAVPALSGHVTVVDFFASWCAPCKASLPALSRLQREFAAQGVIFVGIGIDEKATKHAAFVAELAPAFTTLHDREHAVVRAVEVPRMPSTFVLGRDGRVRAIHTGYHGADSERELSASIAAALSETN